MSKLKIIDREYPNGDPYKQAMFDGFPLGSYRTEGGGFVPTGKRKARATEFEALLGITADRLSDAKKQVAWIENARDELFERQHEFKSNGGTND